jgi:NAD(P)-dependent dehydrogenase (short-subunit alcohol dehydrogenase family)
VERKALPEAENELRERGHDVIAVVGDVAGLDDVERMVRSTVEAFGRIDIFVNSAGICTEISLLEMTDDVWDDVLNVNLRGAFLCLREVGRVMKRQGGGRIVVICSIDGLFCLPNLAHYQASKAGLIHLMRSAAVDLAQYGIVVNGIAPGWIYTDMTKDELDRADRMQYWQQRIPAGHVGTPEDIAEVALFLAREQTRFILGEIIVADGGQTCLS